MATGSRLPRDVAVAAIMVRQKRKSVTIRNDEEEDDDDISQQLSQGSAKPWAKLPLSNCRRESFGLVVTAPSGTSERDASAWAAKYAPRKLTDLLVHSKKVSEVRAWLENQLRVKSGPPSAESPILLLIGPSGVGKSSVVHVLASVVGFELCEWTTPVPTLWQEHLHNAATNSRYVSKLEEFEVFLSNARVYPTLGGLAKGGKLLLIDDLPMVSAGKEKERLLQLLRSQLAASHFPCVVVLSAARGDMNGVMLEILQALEWNGAASISFNPVTTSAILKFLRRVVTCERCELSQEVLSAVAESCEGDVRSALSCLHFLCIGSKQNGTGSLGPGISVKKMKNKRKVRTVDGADKHNLNMIPGVSVGRDCSLAVFHALGKFLYNKRLPENTAAADGREDVFCGLLQQYARLPLDMEEPETILARASMDSGTVLAFLQENMVDFIHDEAIDDVAQVMDYFSDSDFLLGSHESWRTNRNFVASQGDEQIDGRNISAAAAGSVASRGLLFGNVHSAPRKWQALRSPSLWHVEKDIAKTKVEVWAQRLTSHGSPTLNNLTVTTTEVRPFHQRLGLLSSNYAQRLEQGAWHAGSRPRGDHGYRPTEDTPFYDLRIVGAEAGCFVELPSSCASAGGYEDEIEDW